MGAIKAQCICGAGDQSWVPLLLDGKQVTYELVTDGPFWKGSRVGVKSVAFGGRLASWYCGFSAYLLSVCGHVIFLSLHFPFYKIEIIITVPVLGFLWGLSELILITHLDWIALSGYVVRVLPILLTSFSWNWEAQKSELFITHFCSLGQFWCWLVKLNSDIRPCETFPAFQLPTSPSPGMS